MVAAAPHFRSSQPSQNAKFSPKAVQNNIIKKLIEMEQKVCETRDSSLQQ